MKNKMLAIGILIGFVFQLHTSDNSLRKSGLDQESMSEQDRIRLISLLLNTYDEDHGVSKDGLDEIIITLIKSVDKDKLPYRELTAQIDDLQAIEIDEEDTEELIRQLHQFQQGEVLDEEIKDKLKKFDYNEEILQRACLRTYNKRERDFENIKKILSEQG